MAFQPVKNAVQVLVNYRQFGQQLQNQFYVSYTAVPDQTALENIAAEFATWLSLSWGPVAAQSVSVNNIQVTDVGTSGGLQYVYVPTTAINGQASAAGLPAGSTITASWRTGKAGRSFRGRTYHVGLTEEQVVDNAVTEPSRLLLLGAYANLIDQLTDLGYPLCVASRVQNGVKLGQGQMTPILSVVVEPYVDSQRRRLTGRGR